MTALCGDVVVREKRILTIRKRSRERKRSHVLRVVRRNSCQSWPRPIFYFVPVETQRHLCHMPKTRYVLADYGWSPPCSVSKPFIETINERDLLNSTAPLFPPPPPSRFFSGGGNARYGSLNPRAKNSRFVPAWRLIHTLSNLVDSRFFFFLLFFLCFFFIFYFFFFRSSK